MTIGCTEVNNNNNSSANNANSRVFHANKPIEEVNGLKGQSTRPNGREFSAPDAVSVKGLVGESID